MIYVFVLNQTMEGHVVPYLKEVRLASNLPGQLQGTYTYVAAYLHASVLYSSRHHVSSALRLRAYVFRLMMCIFALRGQLRHH